MSTLATTLNSHPDLSTAQNQLVTAEKDKAAMIEKKRKFENDLGSFKKDIEDMEIAITRAEQVG